MAHTASEASISNQHLTDHYTKNYCEENIYWLAQNFSDLNNIFVVFISNQFQQASSLFLRKVKCITLIFLAADAVKTGTATTTCINCESARE